MNTNQILEPFKLVSQFGSHYLGLRSAILTFALYIKLLRNRKIVEVQIVKTIVHRHIDILTSEVALLRR